MKPTDKAFVAMTDDDFKQLPDPQLAEAYMRAILLNHRARMEGQRYARNRNPELPLPEETERLKQRLLAEIDGRGKVWQVSFIGETWLDDAPAPQITQS